MVAIFQKIDHRMITQERRVAEVAPMHFMMEKLPVHIFLSGFDAEFDHVRGESLRKDPKLDLESTYAYVRRSAQQRQIIGNSRLVPESSAMVVHRNEGRNNPSPGKTNNFVCSHCGETGHSK